MLASPKDKQGTMKKMVSAHSGVCVLAVTAVFRINFGIERRWDSLVNNLKQTSKNWHKHVSPKDKQGSMRNIVFVYPSVYMLVITAVSHVEFDM